MSAHAKLSPSSAERWMNCPGSVVLSEGMPDKTTQFAEEGTMAHAVAEAMLLGNPYQADKDMETYCKLYVDHVRFLVEDV